MFQIQDKGTVTEPGLLYYTKNMLTAIFSNICIPISLINRAKYIFIDIVPNNNGIFNLQLVDN